MIEAVIKAIASGTFSFNPLARRRSASKDAVKISNLSFSLGVKSIMTSAQQ
jgi:hypothetical protein